MHIREKCLTKNQRKVERLVSYLNPMKSSNMVTPSPQSGIEAAALVVGGALATYGVHKYGSSEHH